MNPPAPPGTIYRDPVTGASFVWNGSQWMPMSILDSPMTPLPVSPAPPTQPTIPSNSLGSTMLPMTPSSQSFPPGGGPNDPAPAPSFPSSSQVTLEMIDPALRPLPSQDVRELSELSGHQPAVKVNGRRIPSSPKPSGKGKGRAEEVGRKRKRSAYDGGSDTERRTKRGRTKGAANFKAPDTGELLDITEVVLPPGLKGWSVVGNRHRAWARANGMPIRSDKSLENKFKQLVRKAKPTGRGTCPPEVERAHFINSLIEEKVNTRELADEDIVDDRNLDLHRSRHDDGGDEDDLDGEEVVESSDEDEDDEDDGDKPPPPPSTSRPKPTRRGAASGGTKPVPRAVKLEHSLLPSVPRAAAASRPTRAVDVLSRLTESLDPSAQARRDDDRAIRSLQSGQMLALNGQIRDLNTEVSSLRTRLSDAERQRNDAERRADRAELELRFTRREGSLAPAPPYQAHWDATRDRRQPSPLVRRRPPTPQHWEISYGGPGGEGGHSRFVGHVDDHDDYSQRRTPQRSPRFYRRLDTPTPSRSRVRFQTAERSPRPTAGPSRARRATSGRALSTGERNPFALDTAAEAGSSFFTRSIDPTPVTPTHRTNLFTRPETAISISSDDMDMDEPE